MKKRAVIDKWWFWLLISAAFLIIVQVCFRIPAPCYYLDAAWEAGDLLTFVGTIVLGYIAIYQNRKANDINQRLLQIEETRLKPSLSMIMLSEDERNKYSPFEVLTFCIDDNNAMFFENWKMLGNCDLVLWFLLKNMSDQDVIKIEADSLTSAIVFQNSIICGSERTHKIKTICNNNAIEGKHNLPLAINMPDLFVDVYQHQDARLRLNLVLKVTNYDSREYLVEFIFEIVNARNVGCLSCYMFNLKIIQKLNESQSEAK